jgi:hypothetical protein
MNTIKFSRLLEQAFFYDLGRDFQAFERSVDVATETAKQRFQKAMNDKVVGRKAEVRASRGYGQPEKDYVIDKVTAVNIDWYYNKYVVIFKNESEKEFFLKPGFKVKIIGQAPAPQNQPETNTAAPKPPPTPKQEPPAAQQKPVVAPSKPAQLNAKRPAPAPPAVQQNQPPLKEEVFDAEYRM